MLIRALLASALMLTLSVSSDEAADPRDPATLARRKIVGRAVLRL
jgi:hypothetical protein